MQPCVPICKVRVKFLRICFLSKFRKCKSGLPSLTAPPAECVLAVDVAPVSVVLIAPAPLVLAAELVIGDAIFVLLLVTLVNSVSRVLVFRVRTGLKST